MNSYCISGIISNDIKYRNGNFGGFANGSLVTTISSSGKKVYVPFIAYENIAEQMSRIKLGSKVCLSGYIDTFKDNDDNYRLSLVVKDYEVISGEIISTLKNKSYWN